MTNKKTHWRDDLAYWIITRALRHLATESYAKDFRGRYRLTKEGADLHPQDKAWRDQYPMGSVLKTNCAHCNVVFRQTIAPGKPYPGVYCSKTHGTAHREKMKQFRANPRTCPSKHKARYASGESASKHFNTLKQQNPELAVNRIYACYCGGYHIGRWKYVVVNE